MIGVDVVELVDSGGSVVGAVVESGGCVVTGPAVPAHQSMWLMSCFPTGMSP